MVKKLTLFSLTLLLLQACSNSSVIISPLYDRLDDRLRTSFAKAADFDSQQSAEYAKLVTNFHYWHRRSQLPAYAALLDDIQNSIRNPDATTKADVTRWIATTEGFTQSLRTCHPANYANSIIRSMTDEQIETVETRWTKRRTDFRTKYENETPAERVERRSQKITKWVSRLGLEFNDEQNALLRETLTQQISMRKQYFALSDIWRGELFDILDDRHSSQLDARMTGHIGKLWRLLEVAHPEEWQQNRELWADFALQFVESLTNEQRSYATIWIRKMAKTLLKVSAEKARDPVYADNVGCSRLDGA